MKHTLIFCLFILFSCVSDIGENSNETVDKGKYDLTINNTTTGETTHLIANTVDTNWDENASFIFLSTDDLLETAPIGTVTISIVADLERDTALIVPGGLVSKTDMRIGTADQLNARTFEIIKGSIRNITVGSNFISGEILQCNLLQTFIPDGQTPELATLSGTFTAKSK